MGTKGFVTVRTQVRFDQEPTPFIPKLSCRCQDGVALQHKLFLPPRPLSELLARQSRGQIGQVGIPWRAAIESFRPIARKTTKRSGKTVDKQNDHVCCLFQTATNLLPAIGFSIFKPVYLTGVYLRRLISTMRHPSTAVLTLCFAVCSCIAGSWPYLQGNQTSTKHLQLTKATQRNLAMPLPWKCGSLA